MNKNRATRSLHSSFLLGSFPRIVALILCLVMSIAVEAKKVLILGIDGMDPRLLQRFVDEGLMPNFGRLIAEGDFKPLQTSMPPQSPVAWSNFITGMDPGGHGIFDFILGGFVITDLYEQDHRLTDINRVLKDEGLVGFYSWAFAEDAELMARLLREHGGLDVQGADSIIFDQETEDSMERMLCDAEFKNVRTLTEHVDLVFRDEEEWWQEMWDIGWRYHMKEIKTKGENQLKRFNSCLFFTYKISFGNNTEHERYCRQTCWV